MCLMLGVTYTQRLMVCEFGTFGQIRKSGDEDPDAAVAVGGQRDPPLLVDRL